MKHPPPKTLDWYDVPEAAAILHMHPETLRTLLRRGEIKGTRKGPGLRARWLIHQDHITEYLERNTNEHCY